jgi:hypothetical protein
VWYGAGSNVAGVPAEGLPRCCNVNAFLIAHNQPTYSIDPDSAAAVRDDHLDAAAPALRGGLRLRRF